MTEKTLIELLKKFRVEKRLSFEKAARLVDVSFNTWARWESGRIKPDKTNLKKLAKLIKGV